MLSHAVDNQCMKKLLLILIAAFALACQSRDQSSDPGAGSELEEYGPVDPAESDTSNVQRDTTTRDGGEN